MPPASSDGSSGVSDLFCSIFYILGVNVRDRDDHCPMGGSDDTNAGCIYIPGWVHILVDRIPAHPLNVGFVALGYSGFPNLHLHYN